MALINTFRRPQLLWVKLGFTQVRIFPKIEYSSHTDLLMAKKKLLCESESYGYTGNIYRRVITKVSLI